MATDTACQKFVREVIEGNKDRLNNISREIWSKPERSFQEQHAHNVLTTFLAEEGFQVERNYISPTGFRAIFGVSEQVTESNSKPTPPLNACFLCEYDAVPEIGHAAGHNLSTEASIAAAVGLKTCLEQKRLRGKVTVLGTPAEDSGKGLKIDMLEQGAFEDVTFCMMLSPMNANILSPMSYTLVLVTVQYTGKAAHASAFSWEGKNALDAAVACYTNIALLRQQMKPSWNISGIITKGGIQPNVIPQNTELQFWLRAPDARDLVLMQQRCQACFVAAAKATGCEVEFFFSSKQYYPIEHNVVLSKVYKQHAEILGIDFSESEVALEGLHKGSSDMGNVSQIVPCINPAYDIDTKAVINSAAFHEASGTQEAHDNTLRAALAMAFTAESIFSNPKLLAEMQEEHEAEHKHSSMSRLVRQASQS